MVRKDRLTHPVTLILIKVCDGYEDVVRYETTNGNHDRTRSHISQEIAKADYIYRDYGVRLGCDVIKGRETEISVGWIPLRV